MKRMRATAMAGMLVVACGTAAFAAPHCYTSYGGTKPNKLYLYFPTADDATYPEFGIPNGAPPTSPAHAFNIADLPSYTGTVGDLRDAIYDVVATDYCEFNVQVLETTTAPPNTFPRRNTVSIGTDDGTSAGGLFGLAQAVDTNDPTLVDFAHEWAATYQGLYGGGGGALNGLNSTLQRWANAIGGTAAHEAGHNYGISHNDGLILAAGEDPLVHHIMASGSHFSGENRAGYRRHFSDHEYSVLAANVGLSVQTVWNWDFVNPNSQTATQLQMYVLSTQAGLTVQGPYNGSESPWVNPTVSASLGTQLFQGVTYNRFRVTWSAGHGWDGHVPGGVGPSPGVSGQVAGGATFHIGTGFLGVNYNAPNPIIITTVTLLNGASGLPLHPRAVAFDSGVVDSASGDFNLAAINVLGLPIQLNAVKFQFLPRLLTIDSMVVGRVPMVDVRGTPFAPWKDPQRMIVGKTLEKNTSIPLTLAKLSDGRNIVERVSPRCPTEDRLQGGDVGVCRAGIIVDLFPATTFFVDATITDPNAMHWDFLKQAFVNGPVTTHEFLQVQGRHPDLNKNRVDDFVDILTGKSQDSNQDGVPDEVQNRT